MNPQLYPFPSSEVSGAYNSLLLFGVPSLQPPSSCLRTWVCLVFEARYPYWSRFRGKQKRNQPFPLKKKKTPVNMFLVELGKLALDISSHFLTLGQQTEVCVCLTIWGVLFWFPCRTNPKA